MTKNFKVQRSNKGKKRGPLFLFLLLIDNAMEVTSYFFSYLHEQDLSLIVKYLKTVNGTLSQWLTLVYICHRTRINTRKDVWDEWKWYGLLGPLPNPKVTWAPTVDTCLDEVSWTTNVVLQRFRSAGLRGVNRLVKDWDIGRH